MALVIKFFFVLIGLFITLISQDNEVTLEEAGRILVPDYNDDTLFVALNPPVNPKSKVVIDP